MPACSIHASPHRAALLTVTGALLALFLFLVLLPVPCAAQATTFPWSWLPNDRELNLTHVIHRDTDSTVMINYLPPPPLVYPPLDTVWVGHVKYPTPNNPWNVGRGHGRPYEPPVDDSIAVWDWEHYVTSGPDAESDSLMGWWPIRIRYGETGRRTIPDAQRPWWALDYGNQANYVINQGSPKRSFGVTGVWHRDHGNAAGTLIEWSPIGGVASAWCGLRAHGDNSEIDSPALGGTGSPFNQTVLEYNGVNSPFSAATSKNFPGYASQWDQMLYRDVQLNDGAALTVSFSYRTRMSAREENTPGITAGWFEKDPLSNGPGNYVSPSPGPVRDRFSVYVGAPVNDDACTYSDNVVRQVYDPQHRWFSEVLRVNEPGVPYYTPLAVFGNHPPQNSDPAVPGSFTLPNTQIQPLLDAQPGPGGVVRIVFRVKTNGVFDDQDAGESGYSSETRGAAIIDDVSANGALIGDFEAFDSIDNRLSASPTQHWKSTGKPPAVYFHLHDLASLPYQDPAGPPDALGRCCNAHGAVVSAGDHDLGEAAGGPEGTPEQEREDGIISPVIDLVPDPSGTNRMGLRTKELENVIEYVIRYDFYAGIFDPLFKGNVWTFGFQSYPARQANGVKCWGELRMPDIALYYPDPFCAIDVEPAYRYNLIATSNPDGHPDSIRVFLGKSQQCFRFAVSTGCSPMDGAYFDNVAFGLIETGQVASPPPLYPVISIMPWDWFQDAFPSNGTPGMPGTSAFDTCAALLKIGRNMAQTTGDMTRPDIPGDTSLVIAGGDEMRVDLVFRIMPGVGNYATIGNPSSALRRVPTSPAPAVPGDGSFWGQYLANNGEFGTPGGHSGGVWSRNVWNSARCDTAEMNLFPVSTRGNLPGIRAGVWAAMYHESDPKFNALGILKHRCFLVSDTGAVNSSNVTCTTVPAWATSQAGYDGNPLTREYTKLIPDGLLTPGAHMQYFYRRSRLSTPLTFGMVPDTNRIYPQLWESSADGHRWQQFSVLPDRWKEPGFGGLGQACMLVMNLAKRHGDERVWVSTADSIGATAAAKWGAHNGWHPLPGYVSWRGNQDFSGDPVGANPTIAVPSNGGQAGTTWDLYSVGGIEKVTDPSGTPGSRYGPQPTGIATGMESLSAPTLEMLIKFYRILMILTGPLGEAIFGPLIDRCQAELFLLEHFFIDPRIFDDLHGAIFMGENFIQSEIKSMQLTGGHSPTLPRGGLGSTGIAVTHGTFLSNYLGVGLRDGSYRALSGNVNMVADLTPTNVITGNGDIYGVTNSVMVSNDVLFPDPTLPEATAAAYYEDHGTEGPYVASVYKPRTPERPWISLVNGWRIGSLTSRYGNSTRGRLAYFWNVFNNIFGATCAVNGAPAITLDTPENPRGTAFVDFMRPESENPARGREVRLSFGFVKTGRAQVAIYDVAGRRVRLLADRVFPGHTEQRVVWDGTDDAGHALPRGVYFWRVQSENFTSSRKVVFLR